MSLSNLVIENLEDENVLIFSVTSDSVELTAYNDDHLLEYDLSPSQMQRIRDWSDNALTEMRKSAWGKVG